MKIHILYDISQCAGGGGNQFLKALRLQFEKMSIYTEQIEQADAILFNSHHMIQKVMALKQRYPDKIFVQRIDGPMRAYNLSSDKRDYIVNSANTEIADGTIFQSTWSQKKNHDLGLKKNNYETVIHNAPDNKIFYPRTDGDQNRNKVKIISTSWSSNRNKGFDVYNYLDKNLDFSKYEMIFVGNSPVKFHNIVQLGPLESCEIAELLRDSHIYVSASKNEACSNAILEALQCGLPVVVHDSGSNSEIINNAGICFCNTSDVINAIETVAAEYRVFKDKIYVESIIEISRLYQAFIEQIVSDYKAGIYSGKSFNTIGKVRILYHIFSWKADIRIQKLFDKRKDS